MEAIKATTAFYRFSTYQKITRMLTWDACLKSSPLNMNTRLLIYNKYSWMKICSFERDLLHMEIRQFQNHAQWLKGGNSSGPLDNQTRQNRMEDRWQSAVVRVQNPNLNVAASCLYTKCDCPVAHQNFILSTTVQDCEIGWYKNKRIKEKWSAKYTTPVQRVDAVW